MAWRGQIEKKILVDILMIESLKADLCQTFWMGKLWFQIHSQIWNMTKDSQRTFWWNRKCSIDQQHTAKYSAFD
jgi:hypothetical protein